MRRWKLPPFENVGANQKAIMPRIPQGEVFHGILLKLGGTSFTKAMITQIKLRLGGKVVMDITGSHLDSINAYLGYVANAAYLPIAFAEFNARTIFGEGIGSIDTAIMQYSDFAMEVTIGGATAPTLEAWAWTSATNVVTDDIHRYMIRTLIPSVHNKSGSGKYNLPIPLGSNNGPQLLKRLHHFHTYITELNTKVNGVDLIDTGEVGVLQFEQNMLTRVTQAGHLCLDLLVRDNQSDCIPVMKNDKELNNFQFLTTISAADTITAYSEMYAPVGVI